MQLALQPFSFNAPTKRTATIVAAVLLAFAMLALAFPTQAMDLVTFTGITGPLTSALTTVSELTPGIQALVAVVGFVVAFISLSALRNMGPVLFFVGLVIFGSIGLTVAGAILGAVV
ncbi:MAG: hypothetical protein K1X67_08210 [Fimbriimonadaceae bacterium]|nr:hypothetical protein [Fimbriimonadaceae bacterium]